MQSPTVAAFYASLEPKDRLIHELAAAMLKTRYDVTRSSAYLSFIKEADKKKAA
jgi:hypothetical protein